MSKTVEYTLINGDRKHSSEWSDKLLSSALYYGTGCFETMRYEDERILRFNDHINRLFRGLNFLGLPENLFPQQEVLYKAINDLIQEKGLQNRLAKVRLQCSLLERNGYHFDDEIALLTHISAARIKDVDQPARLVTAKTRVIPNLCRPSDLKLNNMLHYRSAYREALASGCDDALLLTVNNAVAETSVANIFWLTGETVYTPSTDCDILPGIMRETMVKVINEMKNFNLIEGTFDKDSLIKSDVVWLTNSVMEFRPVLSIDGVVFQQNEFFFEELRSGLNKLM